MCGDPECPYHEGKQSCCPQASCPQCQRSPELGFPKGLGEVGCKKIIIPCVLLMLLQKTFLLVFILTSGAAWPIGGPGQRAGGVGNMLKNVSKRLQR